MMKKSAWDCVIVGQGIAGSCAAWALSRRGWKILVFDNLDHVSASRVAAGLITPLTGLRLAPSWRIDELLPAAWSFYHSMERELGLSLVEYIPTLRVFRSDDEAQNWRERAKKPELQQFLGRAFDANASDAFVRMPFGGAEVLGGGRVRIADFLSATRDRLQASGSLRLGSIDAHDIASDGDGWRIAGERTPRIIFCEGASAARNPLWQCLAFRNARGDLIDVDAPALPRTHILNYGNFAVPDSATSRWRIGGNYDWQSPDRGCDEIAAASLVSGFEQLSSSRVQQNGHVAAVRPIVQGRTPVVGQNPDKPGVYILNGLGSKGTLCAPSMAQRLRACIDGEVFPDQEIDLQFRLRPRDRKETSR